MAAVLYGWIAWWRPAFLYILTLLHYLLGWGHKEANAFSLVVGLNTIFFGALIFVSLAIFFYLGRFKASSKQRIGETGNDKNLP